MVVEHFRENVSPLLEGRAKAMMVVGSRLEAVRWQLAIEQYVKSQNYKIATLVAFSGEVNDKESGILVQQANNKTKEQFSNSPDFDSELMNAIMDALSAHTTMSKQALDSEKVRGGLKDVLLGPARLYESLRERAEHRGV